MKFIIPQNYQFKNKIFGVLDYSNLFFNIIWYIILYFFFNSIFSNWNIKIFFIISFGFPITLFSFFGLNNESIFYVLKYLFKYLISSKLYLFKKF